MTPERRKRDLVLAVVFLSLFLAGAGAAGWVRWRQHWCKTHLTRADAMAFADRMAETFNSQNKTKEDVRALLHDDAILLTLRANGEPRQYDVETYASLCAGNHTPYEQAVGSVRVNPDKTKATLVLRCAQQVFENRKWTYEKTLVLAKRDGRVGIIRREKRTSPEEDKESGQQ
jgi:hypothetical protein